MKQAMKDASVAPGDIDHINAHATSTKLNDGPRQWRSKRTPGGAGREDPGHGEKVDDGPDFSAGGALEAIVSSWPSAMA